MWEWCYDTSRCGGGNIGGQVMDGRKDMPWDHYSMRSGTHFSILCSEQQFR